MSEDTPPQHPRPDDEPLTFGYHPLWGFAGVILGVLVLLAIAYFESASLRGKPFVGALYAVGEPPEWGNPIEIRMRRVPLEAFPQINDFIEELQDTNRGVQPDEIDRLIDGTGILRTERIISAPLTPEQLRPLLASGRLPIPGEAELLAGIHARLEEFSLDGLTFKVVGRLAPSVAGFHFAYLLPAHESWLPVFEGHPDAEIGWLDPTGQQTLAEMEDPKGAIEDYRLSTLQVPIHPKYTAATISGLMLVAIFGLMAHLSVFRILYTRRCGPLRPALRVFLTWPKTVIAMHAFLYGGFFVSMLIATRLPLIQMWLTNMIQYEFSSGGLGYVGDAYASGNVMRAALATFFNNFVLQTLGMTVLVSLVIPGIGILKTLLSFVLVGFGMVPVWSGTTAMFTFHSITMTLELEAYIFTCVCVFYFWVNLTIGIFKNQFGRRLKQSCLALMSGTLLAALMLALAGLYEAATLILARG
ncbi:MAG: hypothetical protein VCD00_10815 [Candidatus Hydrogenedentota bacterium]